MVSNGKRVRCESEVWYVRYKEGPTWKRAKAYTDKRASEKLAERIRRNLEQRQEGLPDEEHCKRPLGEHLKAYRKFLESSAEITTEGHIDDTVAQATRVMDGCGFKYLRDIDADKVGEFLAGLRKDSPEGKQGLSIRTINHLLRSVKAFAQWLFKGDGMASPVEDLKRGNHELDPRHPRPGAHRRRSRATFLRPPKPVSTQYEAGVASEDRYWLYAWHAKRLEGWRTAFPAP